MTASSVPHEEARPASPADVDGLVALAAAAADEKRAQKGGEVWWRRERRQGDLREALAALIDAGDHEVVVGTLDGAVVGYGVVRREQLADGGLLGVIDDLYVEPGARAVGLGEVLMDHLVRWCRDQGCFGVDSLALPGDRSTKNFFESFGLVARAIVVHRPLT
ncbi:MAG TPA: GNAT family N-acetyltransferase [Acidimicrobiales bacterium]|nr:GNAT family N-acetyltransferase [Acidimicrobiales bacterium]